MRTAHAAALGAAIAFALPASVVAQAACGPRSALLGELERSYGETLRAMAILNNGQMLEVLVGAAGSFTLVVTGTSGVSCIVAAGEAWEDAGPASPVRPGQES